MKPLQRPSLLWFGRAPRKEYASEIAGRDMNLQIVTSQQPQTRYARAAVFWAADTEFDATLDVLERHLVACINEGLLVYVVVSDDVAQVTHVRQAIDALVPRHASERNVIVRSDTVSSHELANEALLHDPGPVLNEALTFEGDISNLTPQRKLLLQRAFSDSSILKLTPIKAGFSGASTFIVHATINASPPLPEPMPFFVKLGDSAKLLDELTRFRRHAEHYITWNLRPNFLMEKSIYGVSEGVLIGTFVEGSKSLAECARAGGGEKYIAALFDETLTGWRKRADSHRGSNSVVAALAAYDRHASIPSQRVQQARLLFGGEVWAPTTLWRRLISAPRQSWLECVMHGDMHGDNVRVRKDDAIVIDFAQADKGPACADAASLEVWLAFQSDGLDLKQWQSWVEHLYRSDIIDSMLDGTTVDQGCWIHGCLRKIRLIGRSCVLGHDEYKRVLAVFLLRHASFEASPSDAEADEFRRCFAYWLVNRLVMSFATEAKNPQVETA
ncbi:phosphotransferase [Variovorax sp. Root434]|uniref:phosphotransferase n=1 Tax=Variovorax sp. Root434 TaxID=1736536 RepID=UPI000B173B94|nr:phosphotransferase [Variovorax sp. Root434]